MTVTGVDDATSDGNITFNIVTAPAVSTDPSYSGRDAENVAVTNLDNDAADLRVTITDNPDPVAVNGELKYTIDVTNDGPSSAAVVLTVTLPPLNPNTTVPGDDIEVDDGTIGDGIRVGNVVTYNLGPLAPGGTARRTIDIRPLAGAVNLKLAASAKVSSSLLDPDPQDNEAKAETVVASSFRVTDVSDTTLVGPFKPGTLRYAIDLANAFPNVGGPDVIEFAPDSTARRSSWPGPCRSSRKR